MNTPMTPRNLHRRSAPATLSIAARISARMRIPRVLVHHPVLSGGRDYLRALRAAEIAAWDAGLPVTAAKFWLGHSDLNMSGAVKE